MVRHRSALSFVWYGLLLVPLIFLALFFFYPLASIFGVSFAPDGQLDLSGLQTVFFSGSFWGTIWFTVWQAALSTLLTVGLALPTAFVFVRYRFPGRGLLMSLSTLPFVLPTVVVAAAFLSLIGRNGLVNTWLMSSFSLSTAPIQLERTLAIILIVHVFYNYAIALRLIVGYWANQSTRIEEAARVLGANGWRLWWEIRLPVLRPAILAASMLVYIFTFTSFGVILILGGPQWATIEVEIHRYTLTALRSLPLAGALSLVQIGAMVMMMLAYTRLQRRSAASSLESAQQVAKTPANWREWALVNLTVALMVILLFAPLLALVARSFTGSEGFTTQYYTMLDQTSRQSVIIAAPVVAVRNSLTFAGITTIMAVILGVLASYLLTLPRSWITRLLDPVFMLPLATSAVTLGFGFIIALDEPPLNLRTSRALIPIAHTLVAMPFVVRSVLPALRSIPPSVKEAGTVLGANPFNVWRHIELPLISRGLLVGATFAFTVSMGEFGATLFVARPDTPTMPVVIYRLLGQAGIGANYGQALAMSVLLMAVCAMSFALIERARVAGIGEF